MIYDEERPPRGACVLIDPLDPTRRRAIPAATASEDLLVPVFRAGRRTWRAPSLEETRRRAQAQLAGFHSGIKRFLNPHQYPVGLEAGLHAMKTDLILRARGATA
jgi:nicotinate phosphoribosyltransferase